DHRHRLLLRARREWPRDNRAAERDQQLPPSDGNCHTPLPCEVRKGTIPHQERAVSTLKQGRMLGASTVTPAARLFSERRHRGLARRLELWCTAAPERQYLASLRSGLWDLLANDYAATYLDASFVAAISARR